MTNDTGNVADFENIFNPRSLAVVGVSTDIRFRGSAAYLLGPCHQGFKGKIYPVTPKVGEIYGMKCYPSILDIPARVDYVVSLLPARLSLKLVEECAQKGVKTVQFFTSGFSEYDSQAGARLEKEMMDIARRGGVRIIGPNCMGIYCPATGLSFSVDFDKTPGDIAFISQSGGNSYYGIQVGASRGLHFSKVISYGNGIDLNESDFLEYAISDPDTRIISAYVEGTKNGRRFLNILRRASAAKPTVVLKGGVSESGIRTVSSHTGSLAGQRQLWEAVYKQTGAIAVSEMNELLDVLVALQFIKRPQGKRVAIVGLGGGASVEASDSCERAGLKVPLFPPDLVESLRQFKMFSTDAGSIFSNPVDTPLLLVDPVKFQELLKAVAAYEGTDLIIAHLDLDIVSSDAKKMLPATGRALIDFARDSSRPVAVVIPLSAALVSHDILSGLENYAISNRVAVYSSVSAAANAVSKQISYYERLSANPSPWSGEVR